MVRRYGTVAADPRNAETLLDSGAAVLVYPGGDYEVFRPSWQGGKVDFGGRKGWIRLALRGFSNFLLGMALGSTFVLRRRFDPEEVLRDVEEHQCSALVAVPVMLLDHSAVSDALKSFVKDNLARYKVPREVVFLDELPHNPTGKVLKRELAEPEPTQ